VRRLPVPHDLDPIEQRRAWRAVVDAIAPMLGDDDAGFKARKVR
jgi:hypothetical protein